MPAFPAVVDLSRFCFPSLSLAHRNAGRMQTSRLSLSSTPSTARVAASARKASVAARAHQEGESASASAAGVTSRRAVVGLFAGAAAVLANQAQPSLAAYGEAANVFGSKTGNFSGFTPYEGDGYSLLLPAKWNPSKEKDFPGTDLR